MFIICLISHAANNEFYIGFIANLYMVCKDGEHPTTTLFLTKVSLHQPDCATGHQRLPVLAVRALS
jgi:hypothetical protein